MNTVAAMIGVLTILWQSPPGHQTSAPQPSIPASQPAVKVDPELVRRLLGGESSAVDTVEQTLSRMDEAKRLLTEDLNCDARTQDAQAEVLVGIDKLIEESRKSQVSSRGGSKFRRKREARPDRRQSPEEATAGRAAPKSASGTEAGQAPAGGSAARSGDRRSDKAEFSRGWGFLPQRDRDEIAQGFDEEFISKYRDQIMDYYRRLAEDARKRADAPNGVSK